MIPWPRLRRRKVGWPPKRINIRNTVPKASVSLTVSPTSPTKVFPFLDLPGEIRNLIYDCFSPTFVCRGLVETIEVETFRSFTMTCRQVRFEFVTRTCSRLTLYHHFSISQHKPYTSRCPTEHLSELSPWILPWLDRHMVPKLSIFLDVGYEKSSQNYRSFPITNDLAPLPESTFSYLASGDWRITVRYELIMENLEVTRPLTHLSFRPFLGQADLTDETLTRGWRTPSYEREGELLGNGIIQSVESIMETLGELSSCLKWNPHWKELTNELHWWIDFVLPNALHIYSRKSGESASVYPYQG